MSDYKFPYPMWVIVCDGCGPTNTLWEKPGTGGSYVEHCPSCGSRKVRCKIVEDKVEHKRVLKRF